MQIRHEIYRRVGNGVDRLPVANLRMNIDSCSMGVGGCYPVSGTDLLFGAFHQIVPKDYREPGRQRTVVSPRINKAKRVDGSSGMWIVNFNGKIRPGNVPGRYLQKWKFWNWHQ